VEQLRGRAIRAVTQAHLVREYVGSSRRQRAERNRRSRDSIHRLVDGAVPARRQNQIAAIFDCFARQFSGPVRPRSGVEFRLSSVLSENLYGFVQAQPFTSSQAAGQRIINDANLMEWVRDNFRASRIN
jgi:hypothetical protein